MLSSQRYNYKTNLRKARVSRSMEIKNFQWSSPSLVRSRTVGMLKLQPEKSGYVLHLETGNIWEWMILHIVEFNPIIFLTNLEGV